MAVPTTWTELKTELAALAIRDDLDDLIPNFIGYAENWFQRELFSPEREETATLTVTNGVASLPTDFGGVKMVYVDGDRDTVLSQVTPDRLRALYPSTDTDTPLHFAIEGETMLFGAIPTTGLVIKLKYIEGILTLGSGQATNWLLTDHPDLYVNASLAELYAYTRDTEAEQYRRGKAASIAESINRAGRRRKTNSGPLRANSPVSQVSRWAKA
jgi:hypothetical protein